MASAVPSRTLEITPRLQCLSFKLEAEATVSCYYEGSLLHALLFFRHIHMEITFLLQLATVSAFQVNKYNSL